MNPHLDTEQLEDELRNNKSFQHILKFAPMSQRELMTYELAKFFQSYVNEATTRAREFRDIRAERETYKVTQADMAVIVGTSRLTYIKWEKDIDTMSIGQYKRVCKELDRLAQLQPNTLKEGSPSKGLLKLRKELDEIDAKEGEE